MARTDHGVARGRGEVVALLGPTNTGKTHLAIRRMLGHRSGMIGLPLRLLAREVYDRVVAEVGEGAVALVTGEEKIVPPATRFWVCTVESMPVDRPVDFLAVDEIQLAADPARGHVFTDRLLRARGARETWFLGADTMIPLVRTLVPTATVRSQPRLSRLSWAGSRKLTSLAPRSAVVAFRMRDVYALAERLRVRHGGAAVVLGALSPRTRNAQVAMYQSGEVQHLVATDAIGMGLNMDVHHVAFAGDHKFDGRSWRALRPDELAQIAGRAGRWKRDGTFGVTHGVEPLDDAVVDAIVSHRFPPVRAIWWRNAALDPSSLEALQASLARPSPHPALLQAPEADDVRALARLATDDAVRARATTPERVRLLWEVCGVPDFGNVLPEHHAALLGPLFVQLVDGGGRLDPDTLDRQLRRLDRVDGDLETLMGRLAGVRVWTYVTQRSAWLDDPAHWQARAREVEDRLGDALHAGLTDRFVDRRATVLLRHLAEGALPEAVVRAGGRVEAAGEWIGTLDGLDLTLAPGASTSRGVLRAAREAAAPLVASRLEDLLGSPDGAFAVDAEGTVRWDGHRVGLIVAGPRWDAPRLRVRRHDALDGPQRDRLTNRLRAFVSAWSAALSELPEDPRLTPVLRGVVAAVRQGHGAALLEETPLRGRGDAEAASRLAASGVRIGARFAFAPALLGRLPERVPLWTRHHGGSLPLVDDGARPWRGRWPLEARRALGVVQRGPWLLRVDVEESLRRGGARALAALGLSDADRASLAAAVSGGGGRPRAGRQRSR